MINPSSFKEIVLDTGPLLLLLTGLYNTAKLKRFSYSEKDFVLLIDFLKQFDKKIVTPQVLAELSNIAKTHLKGEQEFKTFILTFIRYFRELNEEYIPAKAVLTKRKELQDFGITDALLVECISSREALLLTGEVKETKQSLYWYCFNKNLPVITLEQLPAFLYK